MNFGRFLPKSDEHFSEFHEELQKMIGFVEVLMKIANKFGKQLFQKIPNLQIILMFNDE